MKKRTNVRICNRCTPNKFDGPRYIRKCVGTALNAGRGRGKAIERTTVQMSLLIGAVIAKLCIAKFGETENEPSE